MKEKPKLEVVRGSGNVFRDFGEPDAEVLHMKAVLAGEIIHVLAARQLSAHDAAALTGFAAADFSRAGRAKVRGFTLDKLVAMLGKLDQEVELSFKVRPREDASAPTIARAGP